jgi:hypothetical protein
MTSFADWWRKSQKKLHKNSRTGFNSLVIHATWILWKHRNSCVFYGSAPSIPSAVQAFKDEANLWLVGGAKYLAGLGPWSL